MLDNAKCQARPEAKQRHAQWLETTSETTRRLFYVYGQLHSNTNWKTTASAFVKSHLMVIKVMKAVENRGCGLKYSSTILITSCLVSKINIIFGVTM